jgi:choline dehydrogenase
VITHSLVTRIEFEGTRAKRIAFRPFGGGPERRVAARVGVILAAGTVGSPKLLQLSGFGPAELLRSHGVAVRKDLPGVGGNLRDHYTARIVARGRPGMDGLNSRVRGWRLILEILRWIAGYPGALGISPAHVHVFGKSGPNLDRPDWFLVFSPGSYKLGAVGLLDDFPGLSCGVTCLRPRSTGHVRITSGEADQHPTIQPNYLAEEADCTVLLAAMRAARALIASPAMQEHVEAETFPGPQVQSDDELLDFARNFGGSAFHLVGTCAMGHGKTAVVDERLRVHGAEGLWVADASVMPTLVSANTYAATLMIAEKASDMILGKPPLTPIDLQSC